MNKSTVTCGFAPKDLGIINLKPSEMMYYLYLPISFPQSSIIKLPVNLLFLKPLLDIVREESKSDFYNKHVYVTAKTMYVKPGSPGNRPGWHIDGFMSNGDLNFVWADENPTEFAVQSFKNIPCHDTHSMVEIGKQVDRLNLHTYPNKSLLKLDETVVHRVAPKVKTCLRTFIKVTISAHKFAAKGNSRNSLFAYAWVEKKRTKERNLDHTETKELPKNSWDEKKRGPKQALIETPKITIWKYPIPIKEKFTIELPKGAEILRFANENGFLFLWAKVIPNHMIKEQREIFAFKTGAEMPALDLKYLGMAPINIQQELMLYYFEENINNN